MNHLIVPLALLSLACSGAADMAQERLEEEAAEAITERLTGAENVEIDASTGKVSMKLGDQTFDADNTGMTVTGDKGQLNAGDRAKIPDHFPWSLPANVKIENVVVGDVGGLTVTTLAYTLPDTTLDAERTKLEKELEPLDLELTPRTGDKHRSATATNADGTHTVMYQLDEEPGGIRVRLSQTLKP